MFINTFTVFTQVGVMQLTDFLRSVTAASDLVDCTLVNCGYNHKKIVTVDCGVQLVSILHCLGLNRITVGSFQCLIPSEIQWTVSGIMVSTAVYWSVPGIPASLNRSTIQSSKYKPDV